MIGKIKPNLRYFCSKYWLYSPFYPIFYTFADIQMDSFHRLHENFCQNNFDQQSHRHMLFPLQQNGLKPTDCMLYASELY